MTVDANTVIAEFTMDHPILRAPFARVPDVEASWGLTQDQVDGPTQMTVWIRTDDVDALDEAIEADPGTTNPTVLAVQGNRRLYRFDYTDLGRETNILPVVVEHGGEVTDAVGSNEGWRIRVEFPDREALECLYQFCRSHDIPFSFERIFEQSEFEERPEPALTAAQRAALVAAVDCGYLSVPRECSLGDVADRLGVSKTAASERFRRGANNLIEASLAT